METNKKRRILFCGEASFLATGFSTYWNEVIRRIHRTNEFVIAEMGSYAREDDPRCQQIPWKFYPIIPARNNQRAMQKYLSNKTNEFGEAKFPDVCLDFKPDIILSITDVWMSDYVDRSSLRNNFSWIYMPTIDGEPQRELWLDMYKRCDGILTYSDYGMNLLKRTGRKGTNLITKATPGVDLDVFSPPEDKKYHKAKMGIDPNSIIIGMVARNQKRKLFYDLIEAFSMWQYRSTSKGHLDLVNKTYLYLHTSYPDVGYDIKKAIQDCKVGNRIIMTYLCDNCHTAFPSFFNGELMICRKCGKLAAHPPNADRYCPRNVLADIMKCFDLYVQYSICEGSGMPSYEAMACGVPVMAVDYSAMKDYFDCPTATPIDVERYFWEPMIETEQKRALPSNRDLANKLGVFLKQGESVRQAQFKATRKYMTELVDVYGQETKLPRFSWDRTAAIWANVIREIPIKDQKLTWLYPEPRIYKPNLTPPNNNMSNNEFVKWVIGRVWNRPDMVHTYFANEWLTALNSGFKINYNGMTPFNRQALIQHFINLINQHNEIEQKRVALLNKTVNNTINIHTI